MSKKKKKNHTVTYVAKTNVNKSKIVIVNKILNLYGDDQKIIDLTNNDIEVVATGCFCHLDKVEQIKLPSNVRIERFAFIDCKNLNNVMIGEDYYDNLSDFYQCPMVIHKCPENFEELEINRLKQRKYFIPDYQRGYKWGDEEINNLLDDLYKSSENPDSTYALQPLVVKEMKNESAGRVKFDFVYISQSLTDLTNFVEVIDGQQRLTTLNLILTYMDKKIRDVDTDYLDMFYESKRYSDNFYVNKAKDIIVKWFKKNNFVNKSEIAYCKHKDRISKFKTYIENNVFFFYYKLTSDSQESPYELFENINKNIRLTNAELFKAFLLNTDKMNPYSKSKIKNIAYEWDQIERRMGDEELLAFISSDEYRSKTNIDLLLDCFAAYATSSGSKIDVTTKPSDPLYSFNVMNAYYRNEAKVDGEYEIGEEKHIQIVEKIWNDILDVFNFFIRIYDDYYLYHYIGFLRHSELYHQEKSFAQLYIEYKNNKFGEFKNQIFEYVKNIFKDLDLNSVNYVRDKQTLRDIFLYFNIWETMKNKRLNLKFPFWAHKNTYIIDIDNKEPVPVTWQIEHINPRSIDKIKNSGINVVEAAKAYLGEGTIINNWDDLEKEVEDKKDDPTAHFNLIYNLCLLDSFTNEKYKNSIFSTKKRFIIRYDSLSTYIPISTKQIFFKALDNSETLENLIASPTINTDDENLWMFKEQENYFNRLTECFKFEKPNFKE